MHTCVLDYVIQQYKSPNLNFANIAVFSPFRQINARQILPLYSISWETSESVNCVLDSMNTSSASYRHFPGIYASNISAHHTSTTLLSENGEGEDSDELPDNIIREHK